MQIRKATIITIIGLTLLLQVGGLYYAYRSNLQTMKLTVEKNFRMAFHETTDNQVNQLPYPNGTTIGYMHYLQTPNLTRDERNLRMNEELASILRSEYNREIPIAELATVLKKKLKQHHIESELVINRISTKTRQILDSTDPKFNRKIGVLISEPIFINRERDEAVQAIIVSPYLLVLKNVALLYLFTLVLMSIVIGCIASQIKLIIRQQHDTENQQTSFSALARKMKLPVTEIQEKIQQEDWPEIEEKSGVLLSMTEETLTQAKEAAHRNEGRKLFSTKAISLISLLGTLLLLIAWFGYLYHSNYELLVHKVNAHFEEAFHDEVIQHQYPLYIAAKEKKIQINFPETGLSPFAKKQREALSNTTETYVRVYVYHLYNTIDNDYTLRSALIMLEAVNASTPPIPFSLAYMDSVFTGRLRDAGIHNPAVVRRLNDPTLQLAKSNRTSNEVKWTDLATNPIPLQKDSSQVIQGIIASPQQLILQPLWPLLLSLGMMLVLIGWCVFYQVRIIVMQRRLAQFQKDFTYAMIHDMKSPLNSIVMGAHILTTGKVNNHAEKKEKYLYTIADECNHLLTLSNRVVLLTQIDKDELQLHKEEVTLAPLIDDLIGKFNLKAYKPIRFSTTFHRCNSVYADAFCLHEILSNLIDNAIKYSHAEVNIDIVCEEENGFTKIKICDNGLGIPLKEQSRIFKKFERATTTQRSGAGGFGLGLNYVQQVMIAHKGYVRLESIENKFSEFTLFFPVTIESSGR